MNIIIMFPLIFFISMFFAMIGNGGGIFYVPILIFAGFTMKEAPSLSLILILSTSSAALFTFWRNRQVDWKLALIIDPPTNIMAFTGAYFSYLVPVKTLQFILVGVLIIAGILMLKSRNMVKELEIHNKSIWYWKRTFQGHNYSVNLPLILTATASIGVLSGMLGITGGVIKLPIMVLLCGVPMGIAVATSTAMVAFTAASGLLGHAVSGNIDWKTGTILGSVAILGGLIGGKLSLKIDKSKLKKIFGVTVFLIASILILKIFLK
jgi:uncharacterized protein